MEDKDKRLIRRALREAHQGSVREDQPTVTTIQVGNIYADVPPGPARFAASNILRYRPKGYIFMPRYQHGTWDGWVRLISKTGRFPAGLAPYMADKLSQNGQSVTLLTQTARPEPYPPLSTASLRNVTLRPEQQEAVNAAYEVGRGVIHFPTATGKTLILAGIVQRCAVPTLILCHRIDLMRQLADRLKSALDVPSLVGMIGGGHDDANFLTVATFQSIHHRMTSYPQPMQKILDRFGAVMVDEVHHVAADTFGKVMQALPNAYYRFGFSATPFREDDQETFFKVTGWIGPTVSRFTSEQAVNEGRVVPADIFLIDPGEPTVNDLPYVLAYETGVVRHEGRNRLAADLAIRLSKRGPVLILVERIEHGEKIRRMIERDQFLVSFLHGSVDGGVRTRVLKWFRENRVPILIATNILEEGIDLPGIRTVILAGAGRAAHRSIQRIGRGMRTSGGKDRVIVIDFMDKGTVTDRNSKKRRPGSLASQAAARRKTYESEPAWSVAELTKEEVEVWLSGHD